MTNTPSRSRAVLTDISTRAWEHPADRGALVALRKLKGFDTLLKVVSGLFNERAVRLVYLGSAIRVDERQFPELHYHLTDAARILDIAEVPEMYVRSSPYMGAMTIGMDKPIIVLNSALVERFGPEETRFVIAHELGHAASGHAVYRSLLLRLMGFSGVLGSIPLGALGLRGVIAALYEWRRKAELSADRAGLLATQDPGTATRTFVQLASGGLGSELDLTSFLEQGREYSETGDLRDSILRLTMLENASHPFAVTRAAELRRWVDEGEYASIIAGEYPRRSEDDDAKVSDAARDAATSYSKSFEQAQDALGKLVHEAAGAAGSFKIWLDDKLRRDEDPGT